MTVFSPLPCGSVIQLKFGQKYFYAEIQFYSPKIQPYIPRDIQSFILTPRLIKEKY